MKDYSILRLVFIILMVVFFITLMLGEKLWPLRKLTALWVSRIIINITLAIPMFLIAGLLVRSASWATVLWSTKTSFGLLHVWSLPRWMQFTVGFFLLDLSFYYWHWLNHRVPLLWRFHNVHHVDPDLDVSTGIRFHLVEVVYSTLFRLVQIGVLGVAPLTFLVYEGCFQLSTFFHHSNLRLPIKLERVLNKIIVTPRMHGIHHSQVRRELNSNFSIIFCCWDRLHCTLRLNIPQAEIQIGVPGYTLPKDNNFWHLLILPFTRQRDYWRLPDGITPHRVEKTTQQLTFLEE